MLRIDYIFLFLALSFASMPSAIGQCSHAHKSLSQLSSTSPGFSDLEYKYDVNYYYIDLLADDNSTYIEGFTQISLTTVEELDTLVFELSNDLSIDSILFTDGDSSTYIHTENLIQISLNKVFASGENIDVTIFYNGTSLSGGFFAGLTSKTDYIYEQDITYTLSEPFQASKWFPVKQDLQDKADSVRVHISVDEGLMAGSNGILENITDLGNGMKRYEWFSNYPIAYYLISFTVSDYIDYSFYVDIEGAENPLLVQNFIYDNPTILDDQKEDIDKTESMLQLYSDLFGIYPFIDEKYGHCMAPIGGGMEHQTMTTLQNFNFELVAHELAHQWFGDYVTCSSWQDIWINEGFASYAEYLALEFLQGEEEAIEWMDEAHNLALNAKTGSIYLSEEEAVDPSRIFSYYLSYKKGASILNMLRYEINNDETFFNILKSFIIRHKNSLASANDFLELVNEISTEDYSWFFDQWYYGEGYPVFQISYKTFGDSLFIESNQEGVDNPTAFFKTHFDLKLIFENGNDTIIRLFQEKPSETFSIPIDSRRLASIQMDPHSRLLMNSTIFEALIDSNELLISPNPFTDYIELFFSNVNSEKTLYVNDSKGSVVYKETLSPTDTHTINLNSLHSGTYIVTLRDGNQKLSKKIIKL